MKRKVLMIIIAILLVGLLALGGFYLLHDKDKEKEVDSNTPKPNKKVTIIDESSNSRPIAVMIDNSEEARKVQSGLQDAYIVYEMINYIDGRTRFLALYKDKEVDKISPIRSARVYHIDYVLENDAVFVHWGFSPQAETAIKTYKINNVNGMTYGSDNELDKIGNNSYFWTANISSINKSHRRFTSTELINKAINKLNYRSTTDKNNLLKYSGNEIDMKSKDNTKEATEIKITYAKDNYIDYKYDSENKVYKRYATGIEHIDHASNNQITVKNIIAYKIKNNTISGDNSSRQELHNIGSGDAYFISNGYVSEIKWQKDCLECQTKYTYQDGSEVIMNDGNTFIQIVPINETIEIS